MRRAAKLLKVNRTTVTRKLIFLGKRSQLKLTALNLNHPPVEIMEFDDLETFEHTKFKVNVAQWWVKESLKKFDLIHFLVSIIHVRCSERMFTA